MYKVCFDSTGEIIGFDIKNCNNFINLFNIDSVKKDIKIPTTVQVMDSMGRKYYTRKDITTGQDCGIVYNIDDPTFNYEPLTYIVDEIETVQLTVQPDKFSTTDIENEKHSQLMNHFNCNNCICFELMDNMFPFNNVNAGVNIININPNTEIISNKINLQNNKQLYIYLECDNDIQIFYSYDMNVWTDFNNQFFDYDKDSIYIKMIAKESTNIYSFSILIK